MKNTCFRNTLLLSFLLMLPAHLAWGLGVPSPVAPGAGAINDVTPTFQWTSVAGATRYRLAVQYQDSASSYDYWYEVVVNGNGTVSYTTTPSQALDVGKNYRFAVRAETGTEIGPWSTHTYFHLPLAEPTGTHPNAGPLTDTTPTFRWTSVPGATRYRLNVQYQDSASGYDYWFEEVIFGNGNLSYATPSAQALEPGRNYRFTVRGETDYQVGPWGTQTYFHVPLGQPVLQSPIHGALLMDPTPVFDWTEVVGATRYRLAVQYETGPGQVAYWYEVVVPGGNQTSYTTTSAQALQAGLSYRFTVRAETDQVIGPWPAAHHFEVVLGVPGKVAPLTSTVTDSRPTFRWNGVAGATKYRLSVRVHHPDNLHFEEVLIGNGATSYRPPVHRALAADETYRWTVRAEAAAGPPGAWASSHVFTYAPPAGLQAPVGLEPDGPTTDVTPLFDWQSVSGASTYDVEIYEAGQLVDSRTGLNSSHYQLLAPLDLGSYTWRVRGVNSQTTGPWSVTTAFSVISNSATDLRPNGLVVHTARPSLRLDNGGSLAQATLRRFGLTNGALEAPLPIDLSSGNTVLTPQSNLVEHDVYAVSVGGVDYVLTYDTAPYAEHVNLVAFGGRPLAPLGNAGQAFNNHRAFEEAIDAIGQGGASHVLFVPRGRWMVGTDSAGQPGQIKPAQGMALKGVGRDDTWLVAPVMDLLPLGGVGPWDGALIGDDDQILDQVEISKLTISGLYQDPVTPVPGHGSQFPYWPQPSGISLTGDGLHFHDLGLRYLRFGIEVGRADTVSHAAAVANNHMVYTNKGVHLIHTEKALIEGNDIASVDTQGILFAEVNGTINRDARVIGNTLVATQHRGIHLGELDGGVILRNTISLQSYQHAGDRLSAGILANGERLIIMSNIVTGTNSGGLPGRYQTIGGGGIKLENGPHAVLLADNTITGAESDGITLSARNSSIAVVENRISSSGQRGIRVRAGSYSDQGCPEIQPSPFPGSSTAIDSVFLVENTITGTRGAYDLPGYVPHFPSTTPGCPAQSFAYNLTNGDPATWPRELAAHNVYDLSAVSSEEETGSDWFDAVSSSSTARDIAIFQNPYYADDSIVDRHGTLVPDDPSNIFVAYLGSPSIMLDSHASQVSFEAAPGGANEEKLATEPTIHRILPDGSIDPQFQPSYQSRYTELVDLLIALQDVWEDRFLYPSGAGPLEVQAYEKLQGWITKYNNR